MTGPSTPLSVQILANDGRRGAVAVVDGRLVRVRRRRNSVRWTCQECGPQPEPICEHAMAFARTPIPRKDRQPVTEPTGSVDTHRRKSQ